MLAKLLKYDLKNNYKVLIIFYILSIFFSILTRLFLSIDNSFVINIIGKICSGITISMIFNIIINNLMRLWVRFKNNLYGDESYLTHTLPISKEKHYLSKFLLSIITLFTSILVIGLSLFIAYYSKENIELVKNILLPISTIYNSKIITILLMLLFILFLEFINLLQAGYTGIIIGHKMNNNKLAYSILYGFIAYIITQLFVLLILFIVAIFNKDIMNLFNTIDSINIDTIKTVIYIAITIYTITIILSYIINLKQFKKGVNIE